MPVEGGAFDVLIVSAGHAGAQAAVGLRQQGFEGSICIIGDEPDLPYERPPLSKDYLAGAKNFDRLSMRPQGFWRERAIEMRLRRRVARVDARGRRVETQRGEQITYGRLTWAAGGSPRRLTGVDGQQTRSIISGHGATSTA